MIAPWGNKAMIICLTASNAPFICRRALIQRYTTIHYSTIHYSTLHYSTLHSTPLHYTTLHYTVPHLSLFAVLLLLLRLHGYITKVVGVIKVRLAIQRTELLQKCVREKKKKDKTTTKTSTTSQHPQQALYRRCHHSHPIQAGLVRMVLEMPALVR